MCCYGFYRAMCFRVFIDRISCCNWVRRPIHSAAEIDDSSFQKTDDNRTKKGRIRGRNSTQKHDKGSVEKNPRKSRRKDVDVLEEHHSSSVVTRQADHVPDLVLKQRRGPAEKCGNPGKNWKRKGRKTRERLKSEAQDAVFKYLYLTRNLPFDDAEAMSKNTPSLIEDLLNRVDIGEDVSQSVTQFLYYNPINEFEALFESFGLQSHEYSHLVPKDTMFLSDSDLILVNSSVLCDRCGISRNGVGKILKEASELCWYDHGVLAGKLDAYERLGISRSLIAKVIVSSPYLLTGEVNSDLPLVLETLKRGGISEEWIEEQLEMNNCSYNWTKLLSFFNILLQIGYTETRLAGIILRHPEILFEESCKMALSLISFLFKFDPEMEQVCSLFDNFPQTTQIREFHENLRQCFLLLHETNEDPGQVRTIISNLYLQLGLCKLRKKKSIANLFKNRTKLPSKQLLKSKILKANFLLDVGIVEDSRVFRRVLPFYRGHGDELPERFDFLISTGLERNQVLEMVKHVPQIMNIKVETLKPKVELLTRGLGFPISALASFPYFGVYKYSRLKVRSEMRRWLKDHGASCSWSLSTLAQPPESDFVKQFEHHPGAIEAWNSLKKKYSCD